MSDHNTNDIDSRVEAVEYIGPQYVVSVIWVGEPEPSEIDLTSLVFKYKYLRPLRDLEIFKTVRVEEFGYGLDWPGNDDLDGGPDQLRRLEATQTMSGLRPSYFRLWLKEHAGTTENAAILLGVSKRTIAAYAVGGVGIDLPTSLTIGALQLATHGGRRKLEIDRLVHAVEHAIVQPLSGASPPDGSRRENATNQATRETVASHTLRSTGWSNGTAETKEEAHLFVYKSDG